MAKAHRAGRTGSPDVQLEVTDASPPGRRRGPVVPWPAAAVAGGVLTAASTWIVVNGLMTVGWLQVNDYSWTSALRTGTRLWLLSYFAGGTIGGLHVTMPPLGLTLVNLLIAFGLGGYAASQARAASEDELSQVERRRLAVKTGLPFAASLVAAVMVASFLVDTPGESARALIGALVVGLLGGVGGGAIITQWRPLTSLPAWARPVPRAVATAVLTCWLAGSVALAAALLAHRDRIGQLHDATQAGTGGSLMLLVVQLLWLPNFVLWALSWVLGGGFTAGAGTLVQPTSTHVGMLPGLPILGALPAPGVHSSAMLWWLVTGLVAGGLAAWGVLRHRPRARADETSLVGGLAGVLSGLAVTGLALLSGGDVGSVRLVGLGPRPGPMAILASTLMGLSGLLVGLVLGMLRPRPRPAPVEDEAEPEDTLDLSFPPRDRDD